MKKFGIYLLFFLAIAFKSNGQNRFVLEGTIGTYPVVMMVTGDSEGILNVVYFYKRTRHDISLTGEKQFPEKGVLVFNRRSDDGITESFNLKKGSSNEWSGKWKDKKGKELPVILKPIDTTAYNFLTVPELDFQNKEERIYSKARLSGLAFVKDSITHRGKYELKWLHETQSKLGSFEFSNGFPAEILKKANGVLHRHLVSDVNDFFACSGNTTGSFYEYTSLISKYFIGERYISIQSTAAWDCGGAHPDGSDNSFTIDMQTGNEIASIDQLFWFTGKKPVTDKNSNSYSAYAEERGKAIVKILTRLYPAQMKKSTGEECDYSDHTFWNYPIWFFTKKGLYISPSFPHAMRPCDYPEFSYIPYNILKQYEPK